MASFNLVYILAPNHCWKMDHVLHAESPAVIYRRDTNPLPMIERA